MATRALRCNLDITHVPGKELTMADGLSHIVGVPSVSPSPVEVPLVAFSAEGTPVSSIDPLLVEKEGDTMRKSSNMKMFCAPLS